MSDLSRSDAASRQRTLLAALLLSAWGPVATGLAVAMSRSTTQLADFVRRSVELVALFVAWWGFRHRERNPGLSEIARSRLERVTALAVAGALTCSGLVMPILAVARWRSYVPGGNVYPGIAIAVLGLATNSWFWHRYARLGRERHCPIIDSQCRLYRAKSVVDGCVLLALSTVAIAPLHPATRWVDVAGSVVVALYLLGSGIDATRRALAARKPPLPGSGPGADDG